MLVKSSSGDFTCRLLHWPGSGFMGSSLVIGGAYHLAIIPLDTARTQRGVGSGRTGAVLGPCGEAV